VGWVIVWSGSHMTGVRSQSEVEGFRGLNNAVEIEPTYIHF
jgi:hypothetical protein